MPEQKKISFAPGSREQAVFKAPRNLAARAQALVPLSSPGISTASTSAAEMPAVIFGFQLREQTDWPRQLRTKQGDIVEVELIALRKGESNPLLKEGDLLTFVQIVGTFRGSTGNNICLVCWGRVTISAKTDNGTNNQLSHLKKAGCKQPNGMIRVKELQAFKKVPEIPGEDACEMGDEWTFEVKLPHHAEVVKWMAQNARPWAIRLDKMMIKHELRISDGGYRPPSKCIIAETDKTKSKSCC